MSECSNSSKQNQYKFTDEARRNFLPGFNKKKLKSRMHIFNIIQCAPFTHQASENTNPGKLFWGNEGQSQDLFLLKISKN